MSVYPIGDEDLERPALLTLWPHGVEIKAVEPREVESLREALAEAFAVLDADAGAPWVTTQGGTILSPSVLSGLALARPFLDRLETPPAPQAERAVKPSPEPGLGPRRTGRRQDIPSIARRLIGRPARDVRHGSDVGLGRAGPVRPA